MSKLEHPEHSLGANLVLQHIEDLEEENRLNRETLEERVEENPRLFVDDLNGILKTLKYDL